MQVEPQVPGTAVPRRAALLLGGALLGTALAGAWLRPSGQRARAQPQRFVLEDLVPKRFADWAEVPSQVLQVVNPETQALLDKLYAQTLSRTYASASGYRIMLSLAYGDDQRGGLQAHKPESCYPAQGFALHSNEPSEIATPFGSIAGRRLQTSLRQRREPVTYWFTQGDTVVRNRFEARMIELKLALTGRIPDGLLFRVSSIDDQPARAFQWHDTFVADLLSTVPERDRVRLSGLSALPAGRTAAAF